MNFILMLIKENYVKSFCDTGNWHIMCVKRGGQKKHTVWWFFVYLFGLFWFLGVLELTL